MYDKKHKYLMTKTYLYDKLQTLFFDYIHTTFHCVVRKRRKQKIWYQKEKRVAEGKSLVHTWIFSRRRSTPYYYFFLKEICTFLFLLFVGKEELFLLWNYFCIHKYMLYLQYIDTNKHVQCTYYILTLHVCLVIQNHKRAQCLLSTHEKI